MIEEISTCKEIKRKEEFIYPYICLSGCLSVEQNAEYRAQSRKYRTECSVVQVVYTGSTE